MTPPVTDVFQIPSTKHLIKISSRTGNSFGAKIWTDGWLDGPMIPDLHWLLRHPASGEFFWSTDCTFVARDVPPPARDPEYGHVPYAESPSLADIALALANGIAVTAKQERYLRFEYWWCGNHPVRRAETMDPLLPDFRENLLRLRELIILNYEEDRLTAAEVCREMGEFEEAERLLNFTFSKDLADVVKVMRRLIEEGDTTVREVKSELGRD